MRYLAAIVMTAIFASGAQAGMCEDEIARYNKQVAEDNAADASNLAPGVKELNAKITARMKANIFKGCAPEGFYDQLDKAVREAEANCRAHPNIKGC